MKILILLPIFLSALVVDSSAFCSRLPQIFCGASNPSTESTATATSSTSTECDSLEAASYFSQSVLAQVMGSAQLSHQHIVTANSFCPNQVNYTLHLADSHLRLSNLASKPSPTAPPSSPTQTEWSFETHISSATSLYQKALQLDPLEAVKQGVIEKWKQVQKLNLQVLHKLSINPAASLPPFIQIHINHSFNSSRTTFTSDSTPDLSLQLYFPAHFWFSRFLALDRASSLSSALSSFLLYCTALYNASIPSQHRDRTSWHSHSSLFEVIPNAKTEGDEYVETWSVKKVRQILKKELTWMFERHQPLHHLQRQAQLKLLDVNITSAKVSFDSSEDDTFGMHPPSIDPTFISRSNLHLHLSRLNFSHTSSPTSSHHFQHILIQTVTCYFPLVPSSSSTPYDLSISDPRSQASVLSFSLLQTNLPSRTKMIAGQIQCVERGLRTTVMPLKRKDGNGTHKREEERGDRRIYLSMQVEVYYAGMEDRTVKNEKKDEVIQVEVNSRGDQATYDSSVGSSSSSFSSSTSVGLFLRWPTPIYSTILPISPSLNPLLRDYILQMSQHQTSVSKSNRGGWQSKTNFLEEEEEEGKENRAAQVRETIRRVRNQIYLHCTNYLVSMEHSTRTEQVSHLDQLFNAPTRSAERNSYNHYNVRILNSWANVNKEADFNMPHTHPHSYISGVYYVQTGVDIEGRERKKEQEGGEEKQRVEKEMEEGESNIFFLHPNPHPSSYLLTNSKCSLEQLGEQSSCEWEMSEEEIGNFSLSRINLSSIPGKLILFPSWLEHYVLPHNGSRERISISFNIEIEKRATPNTNQSTFSVPSDQAHNWLNLTYSHINST